MNKKIFSILLILGLSATIPNTLLLGMNPDYMNEGDEFSLTPQKKVPTGELRITVDNYFSDDDLPTEDNNNNDNDYENMVDNNGCLSINKLIDLICENTNWNLKKQALLNLINKHKEYLEYLNVNLDKEYLLTYFNKMIKKDLFYNQQELTTTMEINFPNVKTSSLTYIPPQFGSTNHRDTYPEPNDYKNKLEMIKKKY